MHKKKQLLAAIIFILAYIVINLIITNPVKAVSQVTSTDINGIDEEKYPGIKQMILDLQSEHPNWNFKVLYTGIDWSEAIAYEYIGHEGSPRNLVPVDKNGKYYTGDWICIACGEDHYYDNGSWRCASEATIEYMMDVRNSINSSDVFQFMELTYQDCTFENIKQMVSGTFLDNDSYINAIISAGKTYNVSPYYIVALAIQEQGTTGSTAVSGTYPGYEGYYNIFNYAASGNSTLTIIERELTYAKDNGWTSMEASIDGGVKKISTSYISKGQNTLYFQKFDVENSDGQLYWHQYQQNVMAAQNEGVTIRKTFEEINAIDSSYTFVIPLYENTPKTKCSKPSTSKTITTLKTDLVRLNVNNTINLRSSAAGSVIAQLYSGEIVTRLEAATEKVNHTYWDKVMRADGTIGYVARETDDNESGYKLYLVPVAEKYVEEPDTEQPSEDDDEPSKSNDKIKIYEDNKQIVIVPGVTLQEIEDLAGEELTAKDSSGNSIEKNSTVGTGSTINESYTVIMLGDANGDSVINSGDLFSIQKHLIGQTTISEYTKKAMDANQDGAVNSGDLFTVQKHLLEKGNITIN